MNQFYNMSIMVANRSRRALPVMATAIMLLASQNADAQFLKKLGDAVKNAGKEVLESAKTQTNTNKTSANQSSANKSQASQTSKQQTARYEIHKTAETKTMIVRNNAGFMGTFSEGYAVIGSGGHDKTWFVINEKGEKVFDLPDGYEPAMYDMVGSNEMIRFNSGRLVIRTEEWHNREVSVVDTQGKIVKTFKNVTDASQFNNGIAVLEKNFEPIFIDTNGNVVSQSFNLSRNGSGKYCVKFSEGLGGYKDDTTFKYGYIDNKCNIVISPKYMDCRDFSDGLAAVQDDNKLWGFIDKTGKYVIEPMFRHEPASFHSGYAKVEDREGKIHFIDKTGKIVWTPEKGSRWYEFTDNGHLIGEATTIEPGYILNTSFEQTATYNINLFGGAGSFQGADDWFAIKSTGTNPKSHVFDYNGNLLLNCYLGVPFSNGIAGSCDNKEPYYYNVKGEVIIVFNDTQF